MAVPFQVLINDYTPSNFYDEILSTIWFPIHRGLTIVFGFPIKFMTISLHFFWVKPHTVFHSIIMSISNSKIQQAILELCSITSKTVVSSTYFNFECQSPSSLLISIAKSVNPGLVPCGTPLWGWRHGDRELPTRTEQSSFLYQLRHVLHVVNKSVLVWLSALPEYIVLGRYRSSPV